MNVRSIIIIVFVLFSIPTITYAQELKHSYWTGYVKAIIERECNLPAARIEKNNDTIRVHLTKKQAHLEESIRSSLETLPSGKQLQFVIKEDQSSSKSAASTPSLEKTVCHTFPRLSFSFIPCGKGVAL
jgi:hypothetical protein